MTDKRQQWRERRKKERLENEADSLEVGEKKKPNQIQHLNHGTAD